MWRETVGRVAAIGFVVVGLVAGICFGGMLGASEEVDPGPCGMVLMLAVIGAMVADLYSRTARPRK